MNTHLITVLDLEEGLYNEWEGFNTPVRSLFTEVSQDDVVQMPQKKQARFVEMYACVEEDVDAVVDRMAAEWVGYEIKVFNLTKIVTRIPGELRTKTVSKEGVLPE